MTYAEATIVWGTSTMTLLDLLKKQMDICENDSSQDEMLSLWLQIAGEACENYVNNVLALKEVTEQHAGTFSPVSLKYYPVVSLTTITVDGEDVTADYELFEGTGIDYATVSRTSCTNAEAFKQMTLTYQAGFEPLPTDVGFAIVKTGQSYSNETGGTGQVKAESVVGVGRIEYSVDEASSGSYGSLSNSVIAILDNYRKYIV
jgi:hypothetical protein